MLAALIGQKASPDSQTSSSSASNQGSSGVSGSTARSGHSGGSGNSGTSASHSSGDDLAANTSKANLTMQVLGEIQTAQTALAQLMLANGQTTGLVSTSA
jgi:hypothetical protein